MRNLGTGLLPTIPHWETHLDPLMSAICVQAELVDSREEISEICKHHERLDLPHNHGSVTAGVTRAEGNKCQRCWNYSTLVGSDAEHPALCERCSPVIRDMGFKLPSPQTAVPSSE